MTKCAASLVQVSSLRSSLEPKAPDLGGEDVNSHAGPAWAYCGRLNAKIGEAAALARFFAR